MMTKQKIVLFFSLTAQFVAYSSLLGDGDAPIIYPATMVQDSKRQLLVEAQAAYFVPLDRTFKRIFNGGGMYGAEVSLQLNRKLFGWVSAHGMVNGGRSLGGHYKTTVTLVPVGLGLKYFFKHGVRGAYLGVGALAEYLHTKNYSPYVPRTSSNWGGGALFKLGYVMDMSESWLVDIFMNYAYMKVASQHSNLVVVPHSANLSGFMFGGSIGYRF